MVMRELNGQFGKGNKGRIKGSKNSKLLAQKAKLENLFEENGGFKGLFADIAKIKDPYYKVQAKIKMLEYFLPKLKSIDMSQTIEDNRKHRTPEEIQADLDNMDDD